MKEIGLMIYLSRMIKSHEPEYYKWDQPIFSKCLRKDLHMPVNWCPKVNIVLANEEKWKMLKHIGHQKPVE